MRLLRHPSFLVLCLAPLLLLGGCCCTAPQDSPSQAQTVWRAEKLGSSIEGRPIEAWVTGDGPDVTIIMATIHGSESAGTPLLHELKARLHEQISLTGRQVVLVPVANPDGLERKSRHNLSGIDLNRNFPAANFKKSRRHGPKALSEPESRALLALLQRFPPNRVVSIHQPMERIDYDGPGKKLADAMANWCDLPVKRIGSRPGSLGSYVGLTLGLPIITLELPRNADQLTSDSLWNKYGPMLLQSIIFPTPLPRKSGSA